MAYLDPYYDADAKYPKTWSAETIIVEEIERLVETEFLATEAADMPRRLGKDATPRQLSADKKVSRSMAHAARMSLRAWATEIATVPTKGSGKSTIVQARQEAIRVEAARVNWQWFVDDAVSVMMLRCRLVASWAIDNGNRSFGNRAISRYLSEISHMQYATKGGLQV